MKNMKIFIVLILSTSIFISGCASSSSGIKAANISSSEYSDWDCKKIKNELRFLTDEISELSGQQDEQKRKDTMYGWASFLLIWPALFFIKGDGQVAKDLATAKGKQKTLKRLAVEKECN